MRKAIHLSAILFTLLTVLFLLLSGALQDLSQTDTVFIPILVQTIDNINSLIAAIGGVENGMRRIL